MGQAEQQALIKAQQTAQAGDHRVAAPAAPHAAPTPFHQELQQHQQRTPAAPPAMRQEQAHPRPPEQTHVVVPAQNFQQLQNHPPTGTERRDPRLDRPPAASIPAHDPRLDRPAATVPNAAPVTRIHEGQQQEIQTLQRQQHQNDLRNQQNGLGLYAPQSITPEQDWRHQRRDYGWRNDDPNRDPHRFMFAAPLMFGPPPGERWGWQDPDRYSRGYDSSFFQQDPNYEKWRPTINQESQNISDLLNSGDTRGATNTLNNDLWAMRGDIYGQNELLQEVQQAQTGEGAQLYLGDWDPTRGSWDTIEVQSPAVPDGYSPDPSYLLRTFEN